MCSNLDADTRGIFTQFKHMMYINVNFKILSISNEQKQDVDILIHTTFSDHYIFEYLQNLKNHVY